MKAILIIPSTQTSTREYELVPRASRAGVSKGFRIRRSNFGPNLNGTCFQDLRDVLGARIETDDIETVAELLRLSADEPGLVCHRRQDR